jgi:hypothetical protein
MRITKRETTLLAGTVAIVAVVLLGGVWASQRIAGRYRITAYGTTLKKPNQWSDIRLKPNGEWFMRYAPGASGIPPNGTYKIKGQKITLTSSSFFRGGNQGVYTGYLTKNGFVLPASPGHNIYGSKPVTYVKVSSIDIF